VAFAAPVEGEFPFCLDISLASVTGAFIKAHRRAGTPLPAGVALDERGDPTTDPAAAWRGQVLPIGGHKGVGLAMALEVLHAVLSGNVFSADIPSIVSNPEKSAGSSIFVLAVDPGFLMPREEFSRAMRRYAEYIESSPARDPGKSPRYPGRRAGREWRERHILGIPVRPDALQRLSAIARSLGLDPPAA
jgi:LDH2 family malate/lactate/ureidoglycolate dehydrogenase